MSSSAGERASNDDIDAGKPRWRAGPFFTRTLSDDMVWSAQLRCDTGGVHVDSGFGFASIGVSAVRP